MELGADTRAFVTGASRGIGRAIAQRLAARGATVGLAARTRDELEALAATLPGTHHALPCDVADAGSTRAAIDAFAQRAGGIDLLVANAGITHYGSFADQQIAQLRQMTDVNWSGTVHTVHAGLPHLLESGRGHIVIVSSAAALRSFPSAAVYGATKAAQRMFGEALRHELSGTGVSLTMVYPGEVATGLHDHERDRMPGWYRGGADAVSPDEIAGRTLDGVERDARAVHHPSAVRLLGVLHTVWPQGSDALLRRLRGRSAAPRR
jgi:short-subunit dehydrogenase